MRGQLVLAGRLGQLTLMAYLKLLQVVIAERLWVVDGARTAPGSARQDRQERVGEPFPGALQVAPRAPKEISSS